MAENEAPNEKSLISASDYFTLMENTPLTLVVFDKDGKLIFINKGGREEYFIKDTDDISKWSWLATVKEPYRDIVRGKFQNALRGQAVNFEFEHTPEGSKYAWCSGFMSPIKDEHGNAKMIFFYSTDISPLKRAELEAKEERDMFKTLLDSTPLCIKWFDNKGGLISINKGGREEHFLENLSEDQIKHWDYMSCIDEAYRPEVKEEMDLALKGAGSTFEIKHIPGTSKGTYCESTMAPVKDSNGNVKYILFLSRDITDQKLIGEERKKSEEELKKNNEELEIFNKIAIGRELKMIELKEKIKELEEKIKP